MAEFIGAWNPYGVAAPVGMVGPMGTVIGTPIGYGPVPASDWTVDVQLFKYSPEWPAAEPSDPRPSYYHDDPDIDHIEAIKAQLRAPIRR